MLTHSPFPKITFPTRVYNSSGATLIDNIFCKLSPTTLQIKAEILLDEISDHYPYFIYLDVCHNLNKLPRHVKKRVNSAKAIQDMVTDMKIQDSRFKIALLLPIKHRIIYITVKSTWNVNTSSNTAMHYHGSKGSWKSCRIYGLLVCYTYSKYISTGVQRVQQKKKKQKMTLPVIMCQQHMRYMTSTLFN